jgi:FkbM family methyltransferase
MLKNMREQIQKILRKTGYQLEKFPQPGPDMVRRFKILDYCNIDTLFDIGASIGEYAIEMRKFGYSKKIISFEPLKSAFKILKDASIKDNNWIVNNYAIGDEDIKGMINVAGNSDSSSILNMLPVHYMTNPKSKYIAQEEIEIKKLDSVFDSFCNKENRVMVKIDTQGYEKKVLDGAKESLKNIKVIQLEMSFVQLYENDMLFFEMVKYLENIGFQFFALENGFSDPVTGRLLQADGIFVKKN